jgi:hypothetical protein
VSALKVLARGGFFFVEAILRGSCYVSFTNILQLQILLFVVLTFPLKHATYAKEKV